MKFVATFVFGFSQVLCSKQQTNTLPGQRKRLAFGAPRSNNFPHKPLSLFIGKLFKHVPAAGYPRRGSDLGTSAVWWRCRKDKPKGTRPV